MISDKLTIKARVSEVYKVRSKLTDLFAYLPEFRDEMISISDIRGAYPSILDCFPKRLHDSEFFTASLLGSLKNYLIGATLTKTSTRRVCNRLAGGIRDMARNIPLSPSLTKSTNGYALSVIRNVWPASLNSTESFVLSVELLTGEIAGDRVDINIKSQNFMYFLMKIMGIPQKMQYTGMKVHPRQLSGCHLFTTPKEEDGFVSVNDMCTTSGLKSRNRKLYNKRIKEDRGCGMTHPCTMCPIGADQCSLATHPTRCVKGRCPNCNEDDEWLDTDAETCASFECQNWSWFG